MAAKTIDKEFIEQVILRAGEALRRNEYKRLEDDERLSLTLYLMITFGYRAGAGRVTPTKLSGLHKAVEFAKLCAGNDWVDPSMKVTRPAEAKSAFESMFSEEELHAFDYMS